MRVFTEKRPLPVSAILFIAFAVTSFLPVYQGWARQFLVAVDTGHSPGSKGALSARNRPEYWYNRKMALRVARELNKNPAMQAILINPREDEITLHQRAELINRKKPDLLISIHHDSVLPKYLSEWTYKGKPALSCDIFRGYTIFISRRNREAKGSLSFALCLGDRMLKAGLLPEVLKVKDPGAEARVPVALAKGVYYHDNLVVLREAGCPAALLECGIIRNRKEELLLRNRSYRIRISKAVRSAVESFAATR